MSEDEERYQHLPLIKVVGISASGKSTLVKTLRRHGYRARPVSQEHSNVADLWQQFEKPEVLIYLDTDLETQRSRRPDVTWNQSWLDEETKRLHNAQGYAQLRINTAGQTAEDVARIAMTYLTAARIQHADHQLPPLPDTGSATKRYREEDQQANAKGVDPQFPRRQSRKQLRRQRRKE